MSALNHLSWDNFRTTIVLSGQQRVHRVTNSPRIEMFADGSQNRIGIWLEVQPETQLPPALGTLTFITTAILVRDGLSFVEVATTENSLHRQFYHFALAVAERVIVDKVAAVDAVTLELHCFSDLLEERAVLSIERQIGLLGELIFLEHLVKRVGPGAVEAWVGPIGESHDFRLEGHEYEVKTTVARQRIHTIHGTGQLVASPQCALKLVSVLIGPPGASSGFSLVDKVSACTAVFQDDRTHLAHFLASLKTNGYRAEDRENYSRRYMLRRPLGIAPVAPPFPVISRSLIQSGLGDTASRIESVQYDVNIEGLEYEDGTSEFDCQFPSRPKPEILNRG